MPDKARECLRLDKATVRWAAGLSGLMLLLGLTAGCGPGPAQPKPNQPPPSPVAAPAAAGPTAPAAAGPELAGSQSCRDCHAEFYKLWSTSHHGLAMQPFTPKFARECLTPQPRALDIGKHRYKVHLAAEGSWVSQTGPGGPQRYKIEQVMGGKNVYYFLTPMPRGRLQVLPLAYDVHTKAWFDTAASAVRHFTDRRDQALDWTDRLYTFNTSCYNCHVSGLSTNYDLAADTYHTTWAEPGISCESCHGSGKEHVRVMEAARGGPSPTDLKIIRTQQLSQEQMDDICATCHAKLVALGPTFSPGDRYFDHYDLVVLDHPDYYPDGRNLGENYTFTSWLMSGCASRANWIATTATRPAAGHGSRTRCRTSSACPATCSSASSRAGTAIMPTPARGAAAWPATCPRAVSPAWATRTTPCARPRRPPRWPSSRPTPATSATPITTPPGPTAGARVVSARLPGRAAAPGPSVRRGPQAGVAAAAGHAGRIGQEQRPGSDLPGVAGPAAPLLRRSGQGPGAPGPARRRLAAGPFQRRHGAANPLAPRRARNCSRQPPIRPGWCASAWPWPWPRWPRTPSPTAHSGRPWSGPTPISWPPCTARPDDWASHANLGNFQMAKADYAAAAACFEIAPAGAAYRRPAGQCVYGLQQPEPSGTGRKGLRRALAIEPANAAANFNLGLLLAERGRLPEAEQALRAALKADPQMAPAAYNLGVLLAGTDLDEAIAWCRKAHQALPSDPKYAHVLAFYLHQKKSDEEADRAAA